ncbi:MAG: hypothetical protein JXQ27_09225 [Acidobacteria bacterium]|nr:hypothetical protein [Acidobacteriota bacterium]
MKIAVRRLNRNKGYSFITISGLAVGLGVCTDILRFMRAARADPVDSLRQE